MVVGASPCGSLLLGRQALTLRRQSADRALAAVEERRHVLADFVFGPAQFGPGMLFGIPRAESKVLAAPVVMDTVAHGSLYMSPLSLARFEENYGRTNTSLVRLEGHAQYGTERTA